MAKKKYYAVKVGKVPGIYGTWDECKAQTDGVSGAKFQSFVSLSDAEKFMLGEVGQDEKKMDSDDSGDSIDEFNGMIDEKIAHLCEDEVVAFVDGSYDATQEKSGFGAIIIDNRGVQNKLYKAYSKNLGEEFIQSRNVGAELEGVKEAINWAITYYKRKITIFYDYEGIEKWAKGTWDAKTMITRKYVSFIQEKSSLIQIDYVKVPAHSGVEYNEAADLLAKRALLAKGYKTYNDGSVYFVGFGVEDWKAIVDCINEENKTLSEEEQEEIAFLVDRNDNKDRIVITRLGHRVVINCYSNSRSYVQGRQTVLFQKVITTAIELMNNEQTVVETLNSYHALTLSQEEVEIRFEELLPDFAGKRNGKHYLNLLSAVYNTMLTGYMPDYTSLITPVFRAHEYYLHRILGEKMQLETMNDKGTNRFAYFDKKADGSYECNHSNVSMLNPEQNDYLNKLYSNYNNVRHPYSHWSAVDYETAVITDMETARELLIKGLTLINRYYKMF